MFKKGWGSVRANELGKRSLIVWHAATLYLKTDYELNCATHGYGRSSPRWRGCCSFKDPRQVIEKKGMV